MDGAVSRHRNPKGEEEMNPITLAMFDGFHGSEEASTLGLKPGEWPEKFEVKGLGTFTLEHRFSDGSRRYELCSTIFTFTIWND